MSVARYCRLLSIREIFGDAFGPPDFVGAEPHNMRALIYQFEIDKRRLIATRKREHIARGRHRYNFSVCAIDGSIPLTEHFNRNDTLLRGHRICRRVASGVGGYPMRDIFRAM